MSEEETKEEIERDNISLWRSVEKTNPNYMKDVKYPFPHIAIDAQYQLLTATKLWGSFGKNWGVKNETFIPIPLETKNGVSVIYSATLFYPEGEFAISSDVFIYTKSKETYTSNNDYIKKVATDALTKGLSKLGFSADVFMGGYDGSKSDYNGIDSFVEVEEMTAIQAKTLNDYIKEFETSSPQTANWVKKKIGSALSKKQADDCIEKCVKAKAGIKGKS